MAKKKTKDLLELALVAAGVGVLLYAAFGTKKPGPPSEEKKVEDTPGPKPSDVGPVGPTPTVPPMMSLVEDEPGPFVKPGYRVLFVHEGTFEGPNFAAKMPPGVSVERITVGTGDTVQSVRSKAASLSYDVAIITSPPMRRQTWHSKSLAKPAPTLDVWAVNETAFKDDLAAAHSFYAKQRGTGNPIRGLSVGPGTPLETITRTAEAVLDPSGLAGHGKVL